MKKETFNRNAHNKRLLIVLIAITVVVCLFFAAIAVVTSDSDKDLTEFNPPVNVSAEEDESGEIKVEVPETEQPIESEPDREPEIEKPEPPGQNSAWNLILANPWNKIPEDFTVELADIGGGQMVDARIVNELNQMMSDLRTAGHSAFVCSSYRTNQKQTNLYTNEVNEYRSMGYSDEDAAVEAGKWVAVPGTSEHQTGLAVDIMSSYYLVLDKGQEDTAEQQWLMANSYKYGFILRYPSDKSALTGIYYEPWHYRYVGKDAAKEIYEKGICFEEYLLL